MVERISQEIPVKGSGAFQNPPQHGRKCPICGNSLPPYVGGRPRTYCGVPCRRQAESQALLDRGRALIDRWNRIMEADE